MLQPGDVVKIPPDTVHWHGATPDQLFVHLALSETDEKGEGTAWREHVSEGRVSRQSRTKWIDGARCDAGETENRLGWGIR